MRKRRRVRLAAAVQMITDRFGTQSSFSTNFHLCSIPPRRRNPRRRDREVAVVALRPLRPRSAGGPNGEEASCEFVAPLVRGATRRSATSSTSQGGSRRAATTRSPSARHRCRPRNPATNPKPQSTTSRPTRIHTTMEVRYLMCGVWAMMSRYSSEKTIFPFFEKMR